MRSAKIEASNASKPQGVGSRDPLKGPSGVTGQNPLKLQGFPAFLDAKYWLILFHFYTFLRVKVNVKEA